MSTLAHQQPRSTELTSSMNDRLALKPKFQDSAFIYILLYPLVWLFAKWVARRKELAGGEFIDHYAWFYDQYSTPVKQVRLGAARWPSLKALYDWRPGRSGLIGVLESFWMNVRSAQGLRNRFHIVVDQMQKAISAAIERDGEARILSLACGSAMSVFEAAKGTENVKIVAIDIDESAIEYSQQLAAEYHIANIEWRRGNLLMPGAVTDGFKPNIIEIVGLFDYLSDKAVVGLLHRVGKIAASEAILIAAHIHPNPEMEILQSIADWDMTYRELPIFKQLITNGGLLNAKFITEPHHIFSVVVAEYILTDGS